MNKRLCIVVPQYKEELSAEEQFSLDSLRKYKGDIEIQFIKPRSIAFWCKWFDDRYFESIYTYSELLLSRKFWEAFEEYDYILLYQLDCLLFKRNLLTWCDRGWDYVGAPWVTGYADEGDSFMGVGNGGFSLRNVKKCLQVFNVLGVDRIPADPKAHEDVVWCQMVPHMLPFLHFKVAPIEEAMYFAVETGIDLNKKLLKDVKPTGAHAYMKRNPTYLKGLV